jgi:hypothetical protein
MDEYRWGVFLAERKGEVRMSAIDTPVATTEERRDALVRPALHDDRVEVLDRTERQPVRGLKRDLQPRQADAGGSFHFNGSIKSLEMVALRRQ